MYKLDLEKVEEPVEKAMATHSSTLAWKIPWTEEPGRLQSMRSLRVGHDWATSLSLFTFTHWRRNDNPLQCSCLENPRDGGAWWAAIYGVTQSRTRLKWLSNSRGTRDQIANIFWIIEKARESQKNIYFCFTDYTGAFDCMDHNKLWKILQEMEYQTTLHASWKISMQIKKQQS